MRDSVRVSLVIRDVVDRIEPPALPKERRWARALQRPRRALLASAPFGLGPTRPDIAIARELRQIHPDLHIDWLPEDPVTEALETAGERVHPASAWRASETAHFESQSRRSVPRTSPTLWSTSSAANPTT